MSLQTKKLSRAIGCSHEYGETTCERPVPSVFGAYPEECNSCATRIFATGEGFEAAKKVIEEHYGRLRALTIAASVSGNPWYAKNLHARFALLDRLVADIDSRRTMRRMTVAQRLSAKKENAGKLVNEPRRTSLGYMWRNVTPERAIQLRQNGFEVRFIGVAWQVKVS